MGHRLHQILFLLHAVLEGRHFAQRLHAAPHFSALTDGRTSPDSAKCPCIAHGQGMYRIVVCYSTGVYMLLEGVAHLAVLNGCTRVIMAPTSR